MVEEARAAGDWKPVEDFAHRWWIIACDSMQHPEGRRQMWETVDDIQARIDRGEPLPGGRSMRSSPRSPPSAGLSRRPRHALSNSASVSGSRAVPCSNSVSKPASPSAACSAAVIRFTSPLSAAGSGAPA
ncbi:DUF6247 family protein, partial [Nonomuraea antimicrobica]|uniref:DUF6247 family protein n=1 Tax=Nonomuraea antimicrobica TaxID=561173 RepID=UPI003CD085E4